MKTMRVGFATDDTCGRFKTYELKAECEDPAKDTKDVIDSSAATNTRCAHEGCAARDAAAINAALKNELSLIELNGC